MKNHKLILTLSIIGILTAASAFSQGTEPHVPFSELDPSKGYANEAEYIKAFQKMDARTESPATDQNVKPSTEEEAKPIAENKSNIPTGTDKKSSNNRYHYEFTEQIDDSDFIIDENGSRIIPNQEDNNVPVPKK